jgi:hypothetical protein
MKSLKSPIVSRPEKIDNREHNQNNDDVNNEPANKFAVWYIAKLNKSMIMYH